MPHPCPHHCPKDGPGLGLLAVLAAAVLAAAAATIVIHLLAVLLIVAAVAGGLGLLGLAAVLVTQARGAQAHLLQREPNYTRVIPSPLATRPAQPLPAPRRELEPPRAVHQHLHLHGVSDEQLGRIMRQQQDTAWPAIEDD